MASRRGRRVPEAAPLVGLVIAFAVALFGFLFGPPRAHLVTVLAATVPLYGFTAYGVLRAEGVAAVIRPDAVLAGGVLGAALVAAYGIALARQPGFGVLVALVVLLPPALYHARYGEPVNPLAPGATLAAAGGLAAGLAALGPLLGEPTVWAVDALIIALAGLDYRDERGGPPDARTERALVAGCLGGATVAVLAGLLAGAPVAALLVAGPLVVVGAFLAASDGRARP